MTINAENKLKLIIVSILLACLLILVGVLQLWSPGKPTPFVDENGSPLAGSISEKSMSTSTVWNKECLSRAKMQRIQCCFTFMGVCLTLPYTKVPYRS